MKWSIDVQVQNGKSQAVDRKYTKFLLTFDKRYGRNIIKILSGGGAQLQNGADISSRMQEMLRIWHKGNNGPYLVHLSRIGKQRVKHLDATWYDTL